MNHVLVVDDDAGIRALSKMVLELEGIEVEVVENGQQAYEAILQNRPQAMLLDLSMPVMDGPTLIHKLEAGAGRPPTVIMSAHEPERACRELAVEGCLPKPFDPAALAEKVQALRAG